MHLETRANVGPESPERQPDCEYSHVLPPASFANRLQWAMPVRIEQLGAHLEVYVETLPIITALRLCNRFGRGEACYIQKLPTELVEMIGQFIVEPEREKRLVSWSKQMRCWRRECLLFRDHLTPEQQDAHCKKFGCDNENCEDQTHKCCDPTYPRPRPNTILEYSKADTEMLDDMLELYQAGSLCIDNTADFESRSSLRVLNIHKDLLKSHFGIAIWVAPSFEGFDAHDNDKWTVLAYLTLPGNPWRHEDWPERGSGHNRQIKDSGYGMPLRVGAVPSPSSLKRFPDAMKRLDLELFVHHSLKDPTILDATDGDVGVPKSDKVTEDMRSWPQLTLLVHSVPEPMY